MSTLAAALLELEPEDKFPHSQMYMHGFNDALFLAAKLVEGRELNAEQFKDLFYASYLQDDSSTDVLERMITLMEPYRKF